MSLLLKAGADVNAAPRNGCTPLYKAAERGSEACVSLLLKAGADVNAAPRDGCTPLYKAAEKSSEACVSLLLEAGADADARNSYWGSPLERAIVQGSLACMALLAAAVTDLQLHVDPEGIREHAALLADESLGSHDWTVEREEPGLATVAVLEGESRWRRRRPLALIREQRRAVRDAGLVHKEWKREQEEKARRKTQRRGK